MYTPLTHSGSSSLSADSCGRLGGPILNGSSLSSTRGTAEGRPEDGSIAGEGSEHLQEKAKEVEY